MMNKLQLQVLDDKSPLEILNSFHPLFKTTNGLSPRMFGRTTFAHVYSQWRDKLETLAFKRSFLGYLSTQKGYKFYSPSSKKFYISAKVTLVGNITSFFVLSPSSKPSLYRRNQWWETVVESFEQESRKTLKSFLMF